jgi:NitT/TauT family transport system ATP-binding protein
MDNQKVDNTEKRQIEAKTNVIHFKNVKLQFDSEQIYDNISFDVNSGEFISILGPSGCGKSTSLRIIGGLLEITSGEVSITGKAPSEAWRELSYVFQSARLVPWRNAIKNVTLGMELRYDGMEKLLMENRAKELLSLVGLNDDMEKYPSMLSGGERQRVAIARSLAVDPKIILMDEPFAALDLNTRKHLREELIDIWEKTKKTIIFVTHDIDEALTLADRIILLSDKPTRVLETISINEKRPRTIDESNVLRSNRSHLTELFRKLEKDYQH